MSNLLKEARGNIITGLLIDIFAILFYYETYHFQLVKNVNTVNASFVPRILAVLVFICATLLLIQGWKAYCRIPAGQRTVTDEEKRKGREGLLRIGQVFTVLLTAAIVFKKFGFLLTMPWMMFLLFIILEKKEKRNYKLYLFLSLVLPIVMFIVFYFGFSQLLPMGILAPYLSMFL